MTRHTSGLFTSKTRWTLLAAAALVGLAGLIGPTLLAADAPATLTIKGTCLFGGKSSTWSATLTPKGNNVYDADYSASWSGKPLTYKGTITSDFKTDIKGDGASKSSGTFEFSGKYGDDGIAKCNYKESAGGRGRNGTLTAEAAK